MDELINEYSNMIYRLALSQTKNKSDAEDIFQEVFIKLMNRKSDFENKNHEKAWIIKVTVNSSRKLLTSSWFKKTVPLEQDLSFSSKEKSEVFYAVMDLPIKYRTAIHLFYYEDMSIREISKILNIKESTIKSQLLRAREMLKSKLEGGFDYE